jgi:hypothetical protein
VTPPIELDVARVEKPRVVSICDERHAESRSSAVPNQSRDRAKKTARFSGFLARLERH